MQGWIKLHRKIRMNPVFNDPQLLRLWLICLTEATHKEHDQILGKSTIKLFPGQFVTGRFDLMEMYNHGLKPNERVKGEKTVFRWLETLEKGGFLSLEKTNKFTVVTVDNWGVYQGNDQQNDHYFDQQMTNKRPTNDQQMTTNKNGNNVNNGEEKTVVDMANPFNFYEQNGFGTLSPTVSDNINFWIDKGCFDKPDEMIVEALRTSVVNGKRFWGYTESILVNWSNEGVRNLYQLEAKRKEREAYKVAKDGRHSTRDSTTNREDTPRESITGGQVGWIGRKTKV